MRPLKLLASVANDYKEVPALFYADYLRENYEVVNGYLELYDGGFTLLPGQEYGSCLPVTVLAMNQGTKHLQESREFMEYVFSEEAQSSRPH